MVSSEGLGAEGRGEGRLRWLYTPFVFLLSLLKGIFPLIVREWAGVERVGGEASM